MHNFTYIMENFWTWTLQGYVGVVGFFFWPILLSAIIGYIYLKNSSVMAATIAILLFMAAFATTGIFTDIGPFIMILQIIVTLSCATLVVLFISRWRQ